MVEARVVAVQAGSTETALPLWDSWSPWRLPCPLRYDHDHRFNVFFFVVDPFPNLSVCFWGHWLDLNYKKEKKNILFVLLLNIISLQPEFSSPARFRIQRSSKSVTDEGGGQKFLCLLLEWGCFFSRIKDLWSGVSAKQTFFWQVIKTGKTRYQYFFAGVNKDIKVFSFLFLRNERKTEQVPDCQIVILPIYFKKDNLFLDLNFVVCAANIFNYKLK